MLTYSYLMSLLEEIVFFYLFICHINKQIDIWRVKYKKSFGDPLSYLKKVNKNIAAIKAIPKNARCSNIQYTGVQIFETGLWSASLFQERIVHMIIGREKSLVHWWLNYTRRYHLLKPYTTCRFLPGSCLSPFDYLTRLA